MMDQSESIDCQGQANGIGKIGHCLNQDKPSKNFFSKETLDKITSRVSKEEHQKALETIANLKLEIAVYENVKWGEAIERKKSIMSCIDHKVNMFLINGLLNEYDDSYHLQEAIERFLSQEFSKASESRSQMRLL